MSRHPFKKISVVGLGYIGLPTAAMFASRGIEVVGVDVNENAVATINEGRIHIVEPDLDMVVHAAVHEGYLRATTTPEPAEAFLIAVPTPFKGENHDPDLSYIETASRAIAPMLAPGNLVILESTSPVGATESMADWLADARPDLSFPQTAGEEADVLIAHCPERVLPGKVMQELITNDRVIGGMSQASSDAAKKLYETFVTGECVIATGPRVAEMAKLTENSFRDVNIAFANELSMICDHLGMDVWELIRLANRHPRVNILQPGPGVGGHCIAVDPWFIVSSAPQYSPLIKMARQVNDAKPEWIINNTQRAIEYALANQPEKTKADITIAIYGLAFKADIDDLRESPAVAVAKSLARSHIGSIVIVEPNIDSLPPEFENTTLAALDNTAADVHVMLVDHKEFRSVPKPKGILVDARGIWT
ncbi:UDP-N-acetyl-D-mannosaminuronic acid dehydrogenase [Roseivivax lentus]|uniref:UDP-N-acetyl-D-mannosaminuronic acid dehydrogenase n=1 Tax=Roseivivax lentus TaxID=633194 RepID=A0A1N7PTI5_9RHOB|nr:UDP-N-acetyl-D-mannosamine dehydrogenase [Roseivivax lentus]SIT13921.1 UDP-N-acetyl-D-mannosaminuronic acid dehydrogenase [Roseivivax lentus]